VGTAWAMPRKIRPVVKNISYSLVWGLSNQ
jgi:hypothetical protein